MSNASADACSPLSRRLWLPLLRIVLVLLVLTVPFWFSGLDIVVQSFFYQQGWYLDGNPLVRFLYRWGTLPGLLLACGALFFLFWKRHARGDRARKRAAAALLLTFFLGPGLLINGISKKYTGRPRPREVTQFGGNWQYRHVLDFGVPGRGHSFPAGHPSTGFLLFSLYYSFRSVYPRRARAWMAAGWLYGGVMGFGRIVQGAHFLSDVLWSAGMTLVAARVAHAWTGGDDLKRFHIGRGVKLGRTTRLAAGAAVLAVLILGMLAATPFNLKSDLPLSGARALVVDLDAGNVRIFRGSRTAIRVDARGFAPPFSRCRLDWAGDSEQRVLSMRRHGFFFELNVDVQVILGADFRGNLLVRCGRGDIDAETGILPGRILLETGEGALNWTGNDSSFAVLLRNRKGDMRISAATFPERLLVCARSGEVTLSDNWCRRGRIYQNGYKKGRAEYARIKERKRVFVTAPCIRCVSPGRGPS